MVNPSWMAYENAINDVLTAYPSCGKQARDQERHDANFPTPSPKKFAHNSRPFARMRFRVFLRCRFTGVG